MLLTPSHATTPVPAGPSTRNDLSQQILQWTTTPLLTLMDRDGLDFFRGGPAPTSMHDQLAWFFPSRVSAYRNMWEAVASDVRRLAPELGQTIDAATQAVDGWLVLLQQRSQDTTVVDLSELQNGVMDLMNAPQLAPVIALASALHDPNDPASRRSDPEMASRSRARVR